jgi:regulator of protease activity HflC (stomatin/prohibitin superfamily)
MEPLLPLALAIVLLAAILLLRRVLRRVTVFEYQRGLRFVAGHLQDVLGPGRYWQIGSKTRIDVLDCRPSLVTIPGQEVLTRDQVSIKISLLARYRIEDAKQAVLSAESYVDTLYGEAQLALRSLVGAASIEDLLENRAAIDGQIKDRVAPRVAELGLELLSLDVKDIIFPGALKDAFSQVARARQEGLALLEKARGETAALRNLANAARLIEKSPELYQLRLLQSLSASEGGKLVLHLPPQEGANESS